MQQFPTPPAWWETVTEATEPPAIPPNSRNWRSFDFDDYDEEFWTREEEEAMATKLDRLKSLNRELVLSFASTLQAASTADDYDVEEEIKPIQEAFANIHKELGRLRVYEARRNLARTFRHKIKQRRQATKEIRAQARNVLVRLDALLSEDQQQSLVGIVDGDDDDEAQDESATSGEETVVWIDGSENKDDLSWLFRDFQKRGWKLSSRPTTSDEDRKIVSPENTT